MADEYSIVDVWAGSFASKASLEAYLDESISDEGDVPISKFAEDQNQNFYNSQLVESSFREPTNDFAQLLNGHSFAESYQTSAIAAFERSGMGTANVVLLAFGSTVNAPKSAFGGDYRLEYLGRFDCVPRPYSGGDAPIPPAIFLNTENGAKLLFGGSSVSSIPVDNRGITIGQSNPGDRSPRLDVSAIVPGVAVDQLKIYQDQFEQWVIEDLGDNSLTLIGKESLNLARTFPWNGTRFAVGDLVFVWSLSPAT